MFLLYFAVLSALTPPIAVAALAAAAIADEDSFKIAFSAVRLAAVGFLLPFAFVSNPGLLLLADPLSNVIAVVGGLFATAAIGISIEGSVGILLRPVERLVLSLAAVAAVLPFTMVALIGIAVIGAMLVRYAVVAYSSAPQKTAG